MKAVFFCAMAMGVLLSSSSVLAQSSMLRVGCEGNDVGAEVSLNGKFKGECPLDIQVSEGNLRLRIVKKVDALHERVFEQDIRMGDGTVKRVDARLGTLQLTAEGRQQEAQSFEAERQRVEAARQREEARMREVAQAQAQQLQQQQDAQVRALAEFKAQGIEAGTGKAFRDCADCPEMVWIPPGRLPKRVAGDNVLIAWLNEVTIGYPLAIAKFELTHDEWERCVAESACNKAEEGFTYGTFFNTQWGRGRQPVVNVPMAEVRRYLTWLSKKTGQQYRLLSLAEFTYAARGGQQTKLPWGDELGHNNANCRNCGAGTGGERPVPVGSFAANGWGIHDMLGNVGEMAPDCVTDFSKLDKAPKDGSPIATGCAITTPPEYRAILGDKFVAMGGSWSNHISDGIPINEFYAGHSGLEVGLRVARSFQVTTDLGERAK